MSQPISMKGMPVSRVSFPFPEKKILTKTQREYQKVRQSQVYDQMMDVLLNPNTKLDTFRFLTLLIEEQM